MERKQAPKSAGYDNKMNEEADREFQEFMESISVTKEELAAMVGTPKFSSRRRSTRVVPETNAPTVQNEPQRRGHQYWRAVVAALVAAIGPAFHARSHRKT